MKGKNWREYEPPKKQKRHKSSAKKPARKKRSGLFVKMIAMVLLFAMGYGGFLIYYHLSKPYCIALDAGHGGADIGAEGIIQEVELTERTTAELRTLLQADGRFRVVLSREVGEGKTVTERNHLFRKKHPDIVLSIHGNASEERSANGFECYPSPPGYENYEESLAFARLLAEEMESVGARLRGSGIPGVRFGYYNDTGEKVLIDAGDATVYDYDTFGMLKNMDCPTVLAEQCFVTNAADVENFGTEYGCQKAAAAYYRAICRYLEGAAE